MTSDEIFDLIERISSTSSKKEKEALIKAHASDGLFSHVLEAGLNPFKTYGISYDQATHLASVSVGDGLFWVATTELLNDLETRRLTGSAALSAVSEHMSKLSPKSAMLLARIIGKDFRAGFSETTVNKAIPKLIPTFDCMLAHPFDESRVTKWPQIVEPKLDGVRVLAFVTEDDVRFFTRSGKELMTFSGIRDAILERGYVGAMGDEMVLDGEVLTGSFNKTVSEVRRKGAEATDAEFHVFDLLPTSEFLAGKSNLTYSSRRKRVEEFVAGCDERKIKHVPKYLVNSVAEIHNIYRSVRERGLEGLIVKEPTAQYVNKRSYAWMKIKAEETADVPIVGTFEGTGKYQGMLGGLIVAFDMEMFKARTEGANHLTENAVRVNIGSGFSDADRLTLWNEREQLVDQIIEVEFHEITPDGSLRHPRFKRFRDDK